MNLHLENTVMAVACVGARVSGLLVFSPVLGSNSISPRLKVGLVILLVALLYPVCGPHGLSLNVSELAAVMLTELLAGLLMGIAVQIVFEAAQLAGQIIGMQVGFSLVNILDPNTQVETPVISVFTQMLVTLIFFQMNIHHWLLRGLANSFAYLPVGGFAVTEGLAQKLLHVFGAMWLAGVQIAAPVLIATLLTDLMLGFLGKASPQLPVLFLGLSIKSMVGLSVLAMSLKYWPGIFEQYFSNSIRSAEGLLHLAR
jgi:flagellar biosynthetic protein FliR